MKKTLSILLLLFQTIFAQEDFFILTLPKGGTHMIYKFLTQLTGKTDGCLSAAFPVLTTFYFYDDAPPHTLNDEAVEQTCLLWKEKRQYPAGHLNFTEPFAVFAARHPEYKKIILIRDLRDVLVSQAFWESTMIEKEIGSSSFEDQLMFVIQLGDQLYTQGMFINMQKFVQRALWWMEDPEVIVLRYEDFVGEKGGGSRVAQEKAILALAEQLDIPLTEERLAYLCENIFGPKGAANPYVTFRSGQIGEWKKYFTADHKEAFKEIFGEQLITLGYEQNDEW